MKHASVEGTDLCVTLDPSPSVMFSFVTWGTKPLPVLVPQWLKRFLYTVTEDAVMCVGTFLIGSHTMKYIFSTMIKLSSKSLRINVHIFQ